MNYYGYFYKLPQQIPYFEIIKGSQIFDHLLNNTLITKARKQYCEALFSYKNDEFLLQLRPLGSRSEEVEMDESCFKRKYNRRRYQGQQWIFGATERKGGFLRSVMFAVPDRTVSTLKAIIELQVSKNAKTVYTDSWKGYSLLNNLGYTHQKINHSKKFIQKIKDSSIHTQNIENRWKHVKERMKKRSGKKQSTMHSVYESLFYLQNSDQLATKTLEISKYFINK